MYLYIFNNINISYVCSECMQLPLPIQYKLNVHYFAFNGLLKKIEKEFDVNPNR